VSRMSSAPAPLLVSVAAPRAVVVSVFVIGSPR
jgi:hypothetical protein